MSEDWQITSISIWTRLSKMHWIYLLALKKKARNGKNIDDLEPNMAIFYNTINIFFSERDPIQERKMENLLWRIRSTQMNDLTEGQSFEMVAMGSH